MGESNRSGRDSLCEFGGLRYNKTYERFSTSMSALGVGHLLVGAVAVSATGAASPIGRRICAGSQRRASENVVQLRHPWPD